MSSPKDKDKDKKDAGVFVILANGEFPNTKTALDLLRRADVVICCDGAAVKLLEFGRTPDLVTGDLDSLPSELKDRLGDRIEKEEEQETNDLAKAFRSVLLRVQESDEIVILGATGLREDHTLGNIAHLADFAGFHSKIRMITNYGTFLPVLKSGTFASRPGQQISIFSFDPEVSISSAGLKYPLENLKLHRWWNATLNEALTDQFELSFSGSDPLILFLADQE